MLKQYIKRNERGLLMRRGDLVRVLKPGFYRMWSRIYAPRRDRVERKSISDVVLDLPEIKYLVRDTELADHLEVVELADDQRAVIWLDGRVYGVAGPGITALWKDAGEIEVERYDVRDGIRFEHDRLDAVLSAPGAERFLDVIVVEKGQLGVLTLNGEVVGHSQSGNERNHLFINDGNGQFVDQSIFSGADSICDGRTNVVWDFDGDGWQDIALVNSNYPHLQPGSERIEVQILPQVM